MTDLLRRLGLDVPILLAPMAGVGTPELAAAVGAAGGLAALPAAMVSPDTLRTWLRQVRDRTGRATNVNFFCHAPAAPDPAREARWRRRLAPFHAELGVEPPTSAGPVRAPFDAGWCDVVEEILPEVVSFHFGLPAPDLLARVRATGAFVLATATTAEEAVWLAARGCDAVIAQGAEAGGHQGFFLRNGGGPIGTLALVPQVVDAVSVPVIAAGGIADARGVAAALALGASAVQVGTAYLRCPEAGTNPLHRAALAAMRPEDTVLTNVLTGRPARSIVNRLIRELGPMCDDAPAFPDAASALVGLRAAAEARGSTDFSVLWAGQGGAMAREEPAGDVTLRLAGRR